MLRGHLRQVPEEGNHNTAPELGVVAEAECLENDVIALGHLRLHLDVKSPVRVFAPIEVARVVPVALEHC